jgi:serine/threonine-protein kinase RsbW
VAFQRPTQTQEHHGAESRRREASTSRADAPQPIELVLPARAENVAVVRQVIEVVGASMGLGERVLEDAKLATTEACTNVVRHAYAEGEGPLDVMIRPDRDNLTIVVSDQGRGITPKTTSDTPGLGLPLIRALSDGLDIRHAPERGSRIAMSFSARQHKAGVVEAA